MNKKKPNFIIIMPDQHRADILGCAGKKVKTPNLDRLASEGVRFENTFTQAPLCVPARASFITGRYVHETHCNTNKTYVHENCPEFISNTFLNILKKKNYRNIDIAKMHLVYRNDAYDATRRVGDQNPELIDHIDNYIPKLLELGFTECKPMCGKMETTKIGSVYTEALQEKDLLEVYQKWLRKYPIINGEPIPLPKELYIDYFTGDLALNWLKSYVEEKNENPFCLFIGFPGPHDPFDCIKEYTNLYDAKSIEIKEEEIKKPDRPIPPYTMVSKGVSRSNRVSTEFIQDCRAKYYGNVTLIDDKVGEIVKLLEDNDILDNTWIIYTSDHGEQLGDHKLFMKFVFYRSSVQVPLIIRPPKGGDGKVIKKDVELIDIPATMFDILGMDKPKDHKGKSLLPLIYNSDNSDYEHKELCISQVFNYIMGVTAEWKFVFNIINGKLMELYNRSEDYYENNNLANTEKGKEIGKELFEKYFDDIIPNPDFKEVDILKSF
ncbi:MAG: sulfatase-like hydrolase/transferase [Candidatus Lokiarchaeota archaeon]|nr:sulfatase-like hydrolase/transferase [Candidatus Lokiarchaeota archaeon]MBD3199869.1 sulfatase-like hydrolase/transferase [Candidatus Lokiarchaeota archaeon]